MALADSREDFLLGDDLGNYLRGRNAMGGRGKESVVKLCL
jgi:hypothetical protein